MPISVQKLVGNIGCFATSRSPLAQGQGTNDRMGGWWPMMRALNSDDPWDGVNTAWPAVETDHGIEQSVWNSPTGCGALPAMCVLEFRLESSPSTAGMCGPSNEGPPQCPFLSSSARDIRAFAATNRALAPNTLYRLTRNLPKATRDPTL